MSLCAARPYLGSRVLHLQQLQDGGAVICDGHITNVVHQHLHRKGMTRLAAEPDFADKVMQCLMLRQMCAIAHLACQAGQDWHVNAGTNHPFAQRASVLF